MTSSNDVALYEGGQLDAYRPQIMTPDAARELDKQLRACTRAVLREGTDFGALPGTDGKSVLFKPGAEKLLQWFGLSYSCDRLETEHDDEGRKEGVTYRASVVRRLPDGALMPIATCDGYAGYDEDKFFQSVEEVQRKAEYNERKWAKQYSRVADPTKWKSRGEHRAPWNTVIKMAQKRAIVGAVINATAAGGLFTVDDDGDQAPADGAPSWYQQKLGEAAAFAAIDDGNRLYAEVTRAKVSGAITRDQADHVQNRIKQRIRQLSTHVQADVEHLTPDGPQDASPADKTAPAAPRSGPPLQQVDGPAGEARPPALIATGQKNALERERQRLGYGDTEEDWSDWLADLAKLAGIAAIAAPGELTQAEAKRVLDQLKKLDAAALRKLPDTGEIAGGGSGGE